MSIQTDLQQAIENFLLDCARNKYVPPSLVKAHWAKEQLAYLNGIVEALEQYDQRGIRHYRRNEQTPQIIRRYLGEYLSGGISYELTRTKVESLCQEAEAYLQEQGFDASLAPATTLRRSQASRYCQEGNAGVDPRLVDEPAAAPRSPALSRSPRRRHRKNYYTKIEELVLKAKV